MADMSLIRPNSDFAQHLSVALCETSPTLQVPNKNSGTTASWYDSIATLPENAMTLVIANEFHALPTRNMLHKPAGEKLPLP